MVILKKSYRIFAYCITAVLILAILGVIIYYLVRNGDDEAILLARGAVTTNGHNCASIGASILDRGGTAVDAAIASLFCEGISMPHSMGLGGGFLMTIYIKESGTVTTLNARETAPLAATENMYGGDSTLSTKGGKAIAVPGELKGYWEAHQKYGKLQWKDLVQPTIDMCNEGILVTEYLERFFASQFNQLYKDLPLRETFINPNTNQTYKLNDRVKRPRLAKTLELIAQYGPNVLYNGNLTPDFIQDIQDQGGIITAEDLQNYKVVWKDPIAVNLSSDQVLYTTPLPGSGVILAFILNILNGFLDYDLSSATTWQRIVESFKFGYGKRTELGDTEFIDITELLSELTSYEYANSIRGKIFDNETSQDPEYYGANMTQPEDHGTAHISVLAPNGDAVSVTSTINAYFGAGIMSNSTGIILNDEMDDFSAPNITNQFNVPPSVANFIRPGKRPLSSMCPSIIVGKNGDVELVVGAAGGTKITTSIALIIIKNLWYNITLSEAVDQKRLHHQLFPMSIEFEAAYSEGDNIVKSLADIGHNYTIAPATSGFAAVTAIARENSLIRTATDKRRSGDIAFVY